MLRAAVSAGTEVGKKAAAVMNAGQLVQEGDLHFFIEISVIFAYFSHFVSQNIFLFSKF